MSACRSARCVTLTPVVLSLANGMARPRYPSRWRPCPNSSGKFSEREMLAAWGGWIGCEEVVLLVVPPSWGVVHDPMRGRPCPRAGPLTLE